MGVNATTGNEIIEIASGTVTTTVTGLPASLGQKTMANSTSVAIASDQSAISSSISNLPTNTETAALVTLAAAGAGTTNSADQTNLYARGAKFYINVTVAGGTPTLTVTIQGKDPIGGSYYTLLASAALGTTGLTVLTVYPGDAVTSNVSASDILPKTYRVSCLVGGVSPAVTATVAASLAL